MSSAAKEGYRYTTFLTVGLGEEVNRLGIQRRCQATAAVLTLDLVSGLGHDIDLGKTLLQTWGVLCPNWIHRLILLLQWGIDGCRNGLHYCVPLLVSDLLDKDTLEGASEDRVLDRLCGRYAISAAGPS